MRRLLLATLLCLPLLPAGAATAADRPSDLLVDACRDEKVDNTYSQRTYRRALDQLPADSDQYTGCRDVINRARLAALSNRDDDGGGNGGGGSTGSGGSTGGGGGSGSGSSSGGGGEGGGEKSDAPTAAEQRAVQEAARAGEGPVRIGGQLLEPGGAGRASEETRDLPTPLLTLLAVLALCALAAGATAAWSRVHAHRLG